MNDQIKHRVRGILDEFQGPGSAEFEADTDLFAAGILDSLNMLRFIEAIESEFQIRLNNEDLIPQNLWSLEASATTVERYLKD